MKKLPLPKEDSLTIECVTWFRLQFPRYLIHHTPNEGKRDMLYALKLKRKGTLAGFPDFTIFGRDTMIMVEMKRDPAMQNHQRQGLSEAQFQLFNELSELGHLVFVAYSFEQFQRICKLYLKEKP